MAALAVVFLASRAGKSDDHVTATGSTVVAPSLTTTAAVRVIDLAEPVPPLPAESAVPTEAPTPAQTLAPTPAPTASADPRADDGEADHDREAEADDDGDDLADDDRARHGAAGVRTTEHLAR